MSHMGPFEYWWDFKGDEATETVDRMASTRIGWTGALDYAKFNFSLSSKPTFTHEEVDTLLDKLKAEATG